MSGVITTPTETELSTMAAMRRGDQASALAFRCRRWRGFVKASSSQSSLYLSLATIATSSGEILQSLWLGLFAPNDCEVSLSLSLRGCIAANLSSLYLSSATVATSSGETLESPPTWTFHHPGGCAVSLCVTQRLYSSQFSHPTWRIPRRSCPTILSCHELSYTLISWMINLTFIPLILYKSNVYKKLNTSLKMFVTVDLYLSLQYEWYQKIT